jgi:arsenite/tail-anchored protein-transporting ATPase
MQNKKVIMFSGKGGVGKTTCAAATALSYSTAGKKTLAISTDPKPSLNHIFELNKDRNAVSVPNLPVIKEIGIDQVKEMWNGRFGTEVYNVFSSFVDIKYEQFIDFISSILPGLRDEFMVDYIRELALHDDYDMVIWDTAPLGQTLGLLNMPAMLGKHLKAAPRIYTRLKTTNEGKKSVMDIIKGWEQLSAVDMEFLKKEVGFVIVTIPEALAFEQLDDIFEEFDRNEFTISRLIINNVIQDADSPFLTRKREQQLSYIELMKQRFPDIEMVEIPMFSSEVKGVEKLRQVARELYR